MTKEQRAQQNDIKILDYGSGGGQTVIYLALLGLNIYGVCISPKEIGNKLSRKFGLGEDRFFDYDGKKLPFENQKFDFIFSEQVLEHVHELDDYYRESSRVLKDTGKSYFSFPQRTNPFDSHTRVWFIHYFPRTLRDKLYKMFSHDPSYVNLLLNFKWTSEHKSIASRYYKVINDFTAKRLLEQAELKNVEYDDSFSVRKIADLFLRLPVIKQIVAKIFSKLSNVDFVLTK